MHAVPGQPATEACSLYHKQQHHQCSQQTSPQQACTACTQCARGGGRTSASMNSGDISLAYPLPRRAGQSEACTARHFNAVCTHTVLRSLTSLQNRGAAPCTPGAPAPGLEGSRCGAPRALAALLNCHSQKLRAKAPGLRAPNCSVSATSQHALACLCTEAAPYKPKQARPYARGEARLLRDGGARVEHAHDRAHVARLRARRPAERVARALTARAWRPSAISGGASRSRTRCSRPCAAGRAHASRTSTRQAAAHRGHRGQARHAAADHEHLRAAPARAAPAAPG